MYLEEIILDGFKSYATRTVISNFDSKFNAITGLNGSGKSNILDAICFVLGITNLSQVRVKNLQELVYKQGQAGITKATVTLVFNNSRTDQSPIGYEQYDRITVTRQVVIGGRNKYLIQGHNAQVNQVQNLFHSVQLNVNNPHFLIMQGHITKVLNMKPVEILGMVEEACGTRLYEDKKSQAQKTMEKKDSKVNEINKILNEEITPTLEKLRSQRTAYLQWASNSTEIERLKRQEIAYQYSSVSEYLREGNEENRLISEELQLNDQSTKLTERKNEIDTNMNEIKERLKNTPSLDYYHDKELSITKELVKENSNHTNEIQSRDREEQEVRLLKERVSQSGETIKKLNLELRKKEVEYENSKKDEEESRIRYEEMEKKVNQLEKGIRNEENSSYEELIHQQKRDQMECQSRKKQLMQRMDGCKVEINHLEESVDKLKNESKNGEKNRRVYEERIHVLQNEQRNLEYNENVYVETQKKVSEGEKEMKEMKNQYDEYESKLDSSLLFHYSDPEPHFDKSRVKGLVASLIEVRDMKYDQAIEVTAGGKLYQVVVDNEKTGELLLKKGNLQRRVTIIPLNRIQHHTIPPSKVKEAEKLGPKGSVHLALTLVGYDKEVQEAIEYVFGSTLICDNLNIARKITFNSSLRLRSVTLDGDIFEPSGIIEGGSRSSINPVLPVLSKVNDLKERMKRKEEELSKLRNELKQLVNKRNVYKKNENELELLRHNLEVGSMNIDNELERKNKELSDKKKELENYELEKAELEEKEKNNAIRLNELERKNKELKEFDKKKDMKEMKEELKECKKKMKEKEKLVEKLMNEKEEMKLEYDELVKERNELEKKIEESKIEIENHTKEIEELGKKVDQLREAHEAIVKEGTKAKEEYTKQNKEMNELKKELDKIVKELEKIEKRKNEIQNKKAQLLKLRKEAEKKKNQLLKDYGWLKEEESEFGKEGSDFDFSKLDVDHLRQKIVQLEEEQDQLGRKLNKKVLGMMEKAESEYQELLKKREIIEKDRHQIVKVIDELDRKKKETLIGTYEKVNRDFGSIFSTLLPGASAHLEPCNGDVLKGLEVHVAFGGKEKESLSELSGGQRSLLALSLVLSLLLFKPAPMYILDEVDAALDLSHTQNIGKMLRKHFGQSQFIVVSLKEGMFNNANVIFRTKFVDGVSTVTRTLGHVDAIEKEKESDDESDNENVKRRRVH